MRTILDFEKPFHTLQRKIEALRSLSEDDQGMLGVNIASELERLESESRNVLKEIYATLDSWQKTQVARHPDRPHFKDYVNALIEDFVPLAGDRLFGEDAAIIGGIGRLFTIPVVVLGHEKGSDTPSRMQHNFGMAGPEGYRKAIRLMDIGERFGLPIVSFIDTPGAYPGVGAEERGQSLAIASSIEKCLFLGVPSISVVIGEGGSGGAMAMAATNKVLMLEHSIYTVASPEATASILWRDAEKAPAAARAMHITAHKLLELGIIEEIIKEPLGGAHRAPTQAIEDTGRVLYEVLCSYHGYAAATVRDQRQARFAAMRG